MADSPIRVTRLLKAEKDLGVAIGFGIVTKTRNKATGAYEAYYDEGSESAPDRAQHISDDEMLKSSIEFARNSRAAEIEHGGRVLPGAILNQFPLTEQFAKSLGITSDQLGLLVLVAPDDKSVLDDIDSGKLNGFSMAGTARAVPVGGEA